MRYARFQDNSGSVQEGTIVDGGINTENRLYDPADVTILPPCKPTKVVCVGLNYADHIEETGQETPSRPKLFLKPPNTIAGHEETIELLPEKERIDFEAELGVVIGKRCKNASVEKAMGFVRGFTCLNDISNRDDQRIEQNWVRGKAFDRSCPIGPYISSAEEVLPDAKITLKQNGKVRQKSSIDQMIFSVPELIEEISSFMTLEAEDLIATGTTSGVGPIQHKDVIEVHIEGVGTLVNYFRIP
ncbi:MAG: fumarylacetoacetate hydrolase family protein [Thermoplasmata archaeon]